MTGHEDAQALHAHIRALVRPLVGLDLTDAEHHALVAVADLGAPTATAIAGLLHLARQARPLRTTTLRS
ncbi:hypothetical protein [Actinomycetospora callitridis]|uniref:hypothetical protein n=1 Tax=Actinomycetospora callitridis TaxID=913944 RepID=UPI0023665DB5|nr:hypothetical protein [Actinomycetospora callitridis]MDD7917998.1 hypothetical protein [Actinomycetospora callitridis]